MYNNAKKNLDNNILFKKFLSFFKRLVPSGIFLTNHHLLLLDGHGSHITLQAIEDVPINSV
jgi:hypothetical protein